MYTNILTTTKNRLTFNNNAVQDLIEEMAEQQTQQLEMEQSAKGTKMKKYNREKQKQARRKELETMASAIAQKCVTSMDDKGKKKVRYKKFDC